MSGVTVWFTGLPASGKSTLARRVRDRLSEAGLASVLLDGDEIRAALVPSPGYDERARGDFYATLARLAALLADQGHVVLVAATANRAAYRNAARALSSRFVEVHVASSAEACADRDPKGLYAAGRTGALDAIPGAGAPYEVPEAPEDRASGGLDDAAVHRIVARLLPSR